MPYHKVDTIDDSASMEIETRDDGFSIEVVDGKDMCRLGITFSTAHRLLQFLFEHTQTPSQFHGETSEELPEIVHLALTDAEFYYLQHLFAYFQSVETGDLLNGIKIAMMIRSSPLGHHSELRNLLVDKMNKLAMARINAKAGWREG